MASKASSGCDPIAAIAAVIAAVMVGIYVVLIRQQGGDVAVWFVAGLAAAVILGGYGAAAMAPGRAWALAVSGAVMGVFGIAGILSVGLPIICAGVLMLVAAMRSWLPDA